MENIFCVLGGPRTTEGDREVQRILHLQHIIQELPDSFNDASLNPVANVAAQVVISHPPAITHQPHLKQGHPIGSKDTQPRRRRTYTQPPIPIPSSLELLPHNDEIAINYAHFDDIWDRQMTILNECFVFMIIAAVTSTHCIGGTKLI